VCIYVNIETALKEAMAIDGAVGVALVDWESGMSLGALGGGKYLDLDVAAAGNTEVIRAKMRTMESLRLDDNIEDILITLNKQYHLIRLLKSSRNEQGLFLYLVLDRAKSNLALARHSLKRIEADLTV
jgi:hypothetical protein